MEPLDWVKGFPGSIIVCDPGGTILALNDRAAAAYSRQGGRRLLGTHVLDCHPEPARTKLAEIMQDRRVNVYTIEKNGRHKLVYQTPWFREGRYAGFVEVVVEIPAALPHFIRE